MICLFCQYIPTIHYVFGTGHVTVNSKLYIISKEDHCPHWTADAVDRT